MNVTPNAANQIELIYDYQATAWLGLSQCITLSVAYFLHRAAITPSHRGDTISSNEPLAGHIWGNFDPRQCKVAKLYTY